MYFYLVILVNNILYSHFFANCTSKLDTFNNQVIITFKGARVSPTWGWSKLSFIMLFLI